MEELGLARRTNLTPEEIPYEKQIEKPVAISYKNGIDFVVGILHEVKDNQFVLNPFYGWREIEGKKGQRELALISAPLTIKMDYTRRPELWSQDDFKYFLLSEEDEKKAIAEEKKLALEDKSKEF